MKEEKESRELERSLLRTSEKLEIDTNSAQRVSYAQEVSSTLPDIRMSLEEGESLFCRKLRKCCCYNILLFRF
ncbi:hypothetical protein K6025_00365 [Ehrlichia sp. JZT12]